MKSINILIVTLFCVTNVLFAQEGDTNNIKVSAFTDPVAEIPEFPGGEEARVKFIADNLVYPKKARKKDIQGMVYVTFIVETDGSVSNVKVVRGIGGGCDEEAARVAKLMPKWKPGKQDGKSVRVQFTMPIKFTLTED